MKIYKYTHTHLGFHDNGHLVVLEEHIHVEAPPKGPFQLAQPKSEKISKQKHPCPFRWPSQPFKRIRFEENSGKNLAAALGL